MYGEGRGRHSRNYIYCCYLREYEEFEVVHEAPCTARYGIFSVIKDHWRENTYFIVWRKNRNTTRDTTIMREGMPLGDAHPWQYDEAVYSSLQDAIDAIPHFNLNFEPPPKPKRGPRDSQKRKVYRWEHVMAREVGPQVDNPRWRPGHPRHGEKVPELEVWRDEKWITDFVAKVCRELNEEPVKVSFRSGGRCSFGGRWRIRLLPSHRNVLVILHELAHSFHGRWNARSHQEQSHGKEFVGIYIYLLARFGGCDAQAVTMHAHRSKVKVVMPDRYWTWDALRKEAA